MNISNYLKNEAALHEDVDIRYILLLLSFGPQFCHKFFYFLPSLSPCNAFSKMCTNIYFFFIVVDN